MGAVIMTMLNGFNPSPRFGVDGWVLLTACDWPNAAALLLCAPTHLLCFCVGLCCAVYPMSGPDQGICPSTSPLGMSVNRVYAATGYSYGAARLEAEVGWSSGH